MDTQKKSGTESESPKVKKEEELFICPICDAEHAVPGVEAGEELLCPKCVVPLKAKQVK
jgi:uncharacterized paraquat-inducible protein A